MSPATNASREPRVLVEDLPAEHLEELDYLWDRRARTTRSFEQFAPHLADLDRRLEANVAGLEAVPRLSLPLLEEALAAEEVSRTAAAAWALLRIGGARAEAAVLGAIESGPPAAREGARQALLRGPAAALSAGLRAIAEGGEPAAAAAAAEALAAHGAPGAPRALGDWLAAAEPELRAAACRVAAWTGGAAERLEALAREDGSAAVRAAAGEAGAWLKAPWALAHGRERARAKDATRPEALALFAALAEAADEPLLLALGGEGAFGPERWEWLASFGTGACLRACLAGMGAKDAADAAAAGLAFVRMTGANLGAAKRVALAPPADAGPDAAEFADEAFVPDPAAAARHLEEHAERYGKRGRWCRGLDASGADAAASVDLGSRRVILLRARFRGAWGGTLRDLLLV